MGINFAETDTVRLSDDGEAIEIIDQSILPHKLEIISLRGQEEICAAIKSMKLRGAPAIGVCAGFALYLAAKDIAAAGFAGNDFTAQLDAAKDRLIAVRPTAVNLSWALKKVFDAGKNAASSDAAADAMRSAALEIYEDDIAACKAIGEHALKLLKKGDGLLTHCNAGKLACVRYGTATSAMYLGHEKGYHFKIYCDETRPLLQGARLTAFELSAAGMDVTVLSDNMSASLMKSGTVQAVFVGADRIAANGDTANKIGTSLLALAAKRYDVPFYVCAPNSTIDADSKDGSVIPIEQRSSLEVSDFWYKERMTPENVYIYNPAFDVTDSDLITRIITENGCFRPSEILSSLRGAASDS
jgi:methylthioribose-1-phosphate isomerase